MPPKDNYYELQGVYGPWGENPFPNYSQLDAYKQQLQAAGYVIPASLNSITDPNVLYQELMKQYQAPTQTQSTPTTQLVGTPVIGTTPQNIQPTLQTQPVGQPIVSQTPQGFSATQNPQPSTLTMTSTQTANSQPITQAAPQSDQAFQQYLDTLALPPDQKQALISVYQAVGTNNQAYAERVKSAIAAGTAYSDPYFKAQTRLVTDALDRSLQSQAGDLSYNQTKLSNSLSDLQNDIGASKDYLSFQQMNELRDLENRYKGQVSNLKENMAATGRTFSSTNSRGQELLGEAYGNLKESTNRSFLERQNTLSNQLSRGQRDTSLEVQRLQDLAAAGKLDLLRQTEQQIGSTGLQTLGYSGGDVLGGIGGTIPRAQAQDALSFASNAGFIF